MPRAADIRLLYAIYFGFVGASGPYLPLMFDHWGMAAIQIGALVALSHLIRIVAPPVWGWAADRDGRIRRLLQFGAAVMACVCLLLPVAGGLDPAWRFAAAAAMMATLHLASAGQGPLTETMALRLAGGDLGKYGRMRVWGSVGYILTVIGFGPVLDRIGVGGLPWLLASLGAALWFAIRRLPASPATAASPVPADARDAGPAGALIEGPAEAPARVRDQLRTPLALAFLGSSLLMIMAHAPFYGFFSLYLAGLGYSKAAIGAFWAIGVVAEIALFLLQRRLFDRFPASVLLIATMALAVLRFAVTAVAETMPAATAAAMLVLAQVLHAGTFALHHSASMSLMQRCFGTRFQARAQSLYTAVSYGVGGALGGLGAGVIWQTWGAGATFYAAATAAAAGLVAAWQVHRAAGASRGGAGVAAVPDDRSGRRVAGTGEGR